MTEEGQGHPEGTTTYQTDIRTNPTTSGKLALRHTQDDETDGKENPNLSIQVRREHGK